MTVLAESLYVAWVPGMAGGGIWLLLWLYAGVPSMSVLLPGMVLGYVISSIAFNMTPLGRQEKRTVNVPLFQG